MPLPFYRSLRFKIIGLFSLVVLIGAIAGTISSVRIADSEFRGILHAPFHGTTGIVENFFDLVGQMALIWGRQISADEELQQTLHSGHQEATIKRLSLLKKQATADSVIWLDNKGRVLNHSEDAERQGKSQMAWRIVRSAVMEQQNDSSIVQDLGNFIIYSSALIHNEKKALSGILLVGYTINDELLSQIKRDANRHHRGSTPCRDGLHL